MTRKAVRPSRMTCFPAEVWADVGAGRRCNVQAADLPRRCAVRWRMEPPLYRAAVLLLVLDPAAYIFGRVLCSAGKTGRL